MFEAPPTSDAPLRDSAWDARDAADVSREDPDDAGEIGDAGESDDAGESG